MKFSVNWLREFVDLPAGIETLAETLTLAGVEIEGLGKRGADFAQVVVAQIKDSQPHPNADRLSVCQVDDGSGTARQIVCGAKNYRVADKVPLALPGAVLPNELKIRASKLRGVESAGMLCSAKELGLAEDAAGLMILSPDAKIGAPIGNLFPADTILDVEITPNRGDLLSHYGMAREIAALMNQALREGKTFAESADPNAPAKPFTSGVRISAAHECPFYSARRISEVNVGPSPEWLRTKLDAAGVRSINNIVDITNFVMLEIGQPLHAFDADKLSDGINVRLAQTGEKFLALDGKNYSLGENTLVVADDTRAVGIAGVMGGEETGVTATTRTVLLESAYFLPSSVRRTARTLNLPSDSSYRFERGVDPGMVLRASARATELIEQIAHGKAEAGIAISGELPNPPADVVLRSERVTQFLGTELPAGEAAETLARFGLKKGAADGSATTWKIPSYRRDLQREVDLIEEITRAHGIQRIAGSDRSRFTPFSVADRQYDLEADWRRRLSARGFFEARTSALISRSAAHALFGAPALGLRNPLSEDHVALRPSLLPGLLSAFERNVRAGAKAIALFELGRAFAADFANETRRLGLVLSGAVETELRWRGNTKRRLDLFDLKGAIDALGLTQVSYRRATAEHLALVVEILSGDKVIGFAGALNQAAAEIAAANVPVLVAELILPGAQESGGERLFEELDRYPSIARDIALIVPEKTSHAEISRVLGEGHEPLLHSVELFDLFAGDGAPNLGAGRKSMAYSLTYRDKNRTLTNDEVAVVHARIRERLKSELGAELRE